MDGFCFANAQALVTGPHGQQLSRPLLVEALAFDPVLADTKLIADLRSPITGVFQVRANEPSKLFALRSLGKDCERGLCCCSIDKYGV